MTNNKLVIRRLPPSMKEDDFLKHVSPLPTHDYFCFFEANSGLGPHSYSRAYINFKDDSDMCTFRERFDNYVFLDKEGHEYPAVVEQSFWHKSPTCGPFYISDKEQNEESTNHNETNEENSAAGADTDPVEGDKDEVDGDITSMWLEQDPDFFKFLEKLQSQKKRPQHSPIQTLENNLEELTGNVNSPLSGTKDSQKAITPLIGYVNQQRSLKNSKRVK